MVGKINVIGSHLADPEIIQTFSHHCLTNLLRHNRLISRAGICHHIEHNMFNIVLGQVTI